jgi:hypothetical protein
VPAGPRPQFYPGTVRSGDGRSGPLAPDPPARTLDWRISRRARAGDDILAEAAGIEVGSWYAWPSTHIGHELVAAGMLIMAGGHDGKPLDFDELERWTRVGYERGIRFRKGER